MACPHQRLPCSARWRIVPISFWRWARDEARPGRVRRGQGGRPGLGPQETVSTQLFSRNGTSPWDTQATSHLSVAGAARCRSEGPAPLDTGDPYCASLWQTITVAPVMAPLAAGTPQSHRPWPLRDGIDDGVPHQVSLSGRVTYPPHPSYYGRCSSTSLACAGLLLLTPSPVLRRRLTFAPAGRLVRVLASVHTLLCLQWTGLQF